MLVKWLHESLVLVKTNFSEKGGYMMKTRRLFAGVVFVLLFFASTFWAAGPEATGPIKIGLIGNMFAPFSLSSKAAAMLAVD